MLKLATVFSGIGAIEQAIKQMKIPHRIVFASDNGGRSLKLTYEEICKLLEGKTGKEKKAYIEELYNRTNQLNSVKESYFANYTIDSNNWHEDVRFIDGYTYLEKVDLFVGGSPCQSFSTYGKKMGFEDIRGTLFYEYARLVKEIKPKVFIFENVTGLLSHDKKKTWAIVQEVFNELEYDFKHAVLDAKDYGLPQMRRRLFVVGIRKDLKYATYEFPQAIKLNATAVDYLDTTVDNKYYLPEKGFKYVTDPIRHDGRARVNRNIIGCQTANQQFNWTGDFRIETPRQEHKDDSRIYIGEYNGEPAIARKLTPNECLKLMGFEKFVIKENITDEQIYRQVGNSIAVPVLKKILLQLFKIIDFKENT